MASSCSIKIAKARFSEVIRQVPEGQVVTVSCRGKPVAEIQSARSVGIRPSTSGWKTSNDEASNPVRRYMRAAGTAGKHDLFDNF